DETVAELESDPKVEYAAPNPIARASAFIPNDPGPGAFGDWLKVQWNFIGPAGVNAPDAWEAANAAGRPGGAGVTVAVLDTGVAYQSRGRYRRSPDFDLTRFVSGYDFVAGDKYPNDENGHGTHVTGTIAEATNNGKGLTGLAYGATIMPIRVLDSRGAGDAVSIGRAIRFAAQKGAKVINLSLEFDNSITSSDIPDITRAARYANAKGALIVGAAGNQADSAVAYPARAVHFVSVGATTESLCQADYSNSGPGLDVMAPGGGSNAPNVDNPRDAALCQPGAQGRDIFQQTFSRTSALRRFGLPGGYEGTSMAAPHVSATAALLIATGRLGPNPRPELIEQRIKLTARDLGPDGPDPRYGAGLVDAGAATGP
ncbi:MAG: S8 family serine peptidase, partial [Thermoleophilaceae bacterium]|nr:S8 family serine peptidase [Thermoleophilaceae bacterium]